VHREYCSIRNFKKEMQFFNSIEFKKSNNGLNAIEIRIDIDLNELKF